MSKKGDVKNPCKRNISLDEHWFDSATNEDKCSDAEPDYGGNCETCGASPIVPVTGMCGPCTFGEAETINGNW